MSWWKWHTVTYTESGCTLCLSKCKQKLPKISRQLAKIYFALFCTTFSSAFVLTMMFPFLPFMVEFLLPWLLENEELVSTYTGIVASAMFCGRIFSSYIWGAIADHKGRKPVILASLVLMGLSVATFGFSVNFAMAVIFRFIIGFTNGVVSTAKAVMSEVSDDSTQAFGVSLVGASYGLGIIIGPAVSGAISDPIGQYNLTIDNYVLREYLTRFPYSLPCLVNLLICLLSALIYYFLVPETLGMKKNRRRSELSQQDIELARKNADVGTPEPEFDQTTEIDDSEYAALTLNDVLQNSPGHAHTRTHMSNHSVDDTDHRTSTNLDSTLTQTVQNRMTLTMNHEVPAQTNTADASLDSKELDNCNDTQNGARREAGTGMNEDTDLEGGGVAIMGTSRRRLGWGQIPSRKAVKSSLRNHCIYLKDKTVFLSVLLYCIYSFGLIGWNELVPIWAKTSPHLGGLGFSLGEIGLALTISGVVYLPFSFFLYPLLEKKIGSVKTTYLAFFVIIPCTMLLPNIHYLIAWKGLLWFVLCLALSVNQIVIMVVITTSILFVNNSVTFDKLGAINGLAMALTSIGRTLSPLGVGGVFSLSLSATMNGFGYPLDYRLVFLLLGFVFFLCVFLVACLPLSINKQKIIEDVDE